MTTYNSIGRVAFPRNPQYTVGKTMRKVPAKFVVPTTGVNGDQYILAGPLTLDDRVSRIYSNGLVALTSATACNLGFYYMNGQGTLVPMKTGGGNELWSGVSLATASTVFMDYLTAKNPALDNTKALKDLLALGSDQDVFGGIFLVLTLTVANTAGGTIDLDVEIEEATTR